MASAIVQLLGCDILGCLDNAFAADDWVEQLDFVHMHAEYIDAVNWCIAYREEAHCYR